MKRGPANESIQVAVVGSIWGFGDKTDGNVIASNTQLSKLDAVYNSANRFVTKAPYTSRNALVGWSSLHIRHQTHWLQVIYKSLLGKALPYLSSLVTIATPTRSIRSSRYFSLVIPKAKTLLAAAVHSPSVNSPSNQLPTSSTYLFLFFCSFAHQFFYLHIHICTYITPV